MTFRNIRPLEDAKKRIQAAESLTGVVWLALASRILTDNSPFENRMLQGCLLCISRQLSRAGVRVDEARDYRRMELIIRDGRLEVCRWFSDQRPPD